MNEKTEGILKVVAGLALLTAAAAVLLAQLAGSVPPASGGTIAVVLGLGGGAWCTVAGLLRMGLIEIVETPEDQHR